MVARARRIDGTTQAPLAASPIRLRTASDADHAAPSPALMLQQALSAELHPELEAKWHPAATIGFVVVTCGAFWATVAIAVARAF